MLHTYAKMQLLSMQYIFPFLLCNYVKLSVLDLSNKKAGYLVNFVHSRNIIYFVGAIGNNLAKSGGST